MGCPAMSSNRSMCRRLVWGAGTLMPILALCIAGQAHAAVCPVDTIGIDASLSNGVTYPIFGEEPGQTFTAPESLLTFVRVWREAYDDSNGIGMKLCITETAPDGTPDLSRILYCAPTIVHLLSDHVHPTEFRWDFDPPIVLPYLGKFALFILQDPCIGLWDLLSTDQSTIYSGGEMWYTSRSRCILGPPLQAGLIPYFEYDVVFQAGFCKDAVTAVEHKTWGQLKMLYR